MNFLYHQVPKNMEGEILYPLNELRAAEPELYAEHAKKYVGREKVMEQTIPLLNCLWNDVLHLTAVHPQTLKNALIEAGGDTEMHITCYQIDPFALNTENTIVYLYSSPFGEQSTDDYVPFIPDDIEKYSTISKETKQYYREEYAKGNKPLKFHMVPHVLYRGSITITGNFIITV